MAKQKAQLQIEITYLDIDKVEPDPDNPNVMSDDKFKALKYAIKNNPERYVYPIAVDQNHIIIDGFHRWKACKELGFDKIPCVVRDCKNDVERAMWRQVYNKVRGEHDRVKDKADFLKIYNAKKSTEFIRLLGTPKESFLQLIGKKKSDGTDVSTDMNPVPGYEKSFLLGNVKQITILFTNDEFVKYFPRFKKVIDDLGAKDHTTGFMKMVEFCEKHNSNKEKS